MAMANGSVKARNSAKIVVPSVFEDGIDTDWTGEDDTTANKSWLASPYTGETCTLTIAKTNPSELATVAGFNLQLQSLPANMHIVLKSITLVK